MNSTVSHKFIHTATHYKLAVLIINNKGHLKDLFKVAEDLNVQVKVIEAVGDKKLPKTQADADIELDSRGNPLENASDTLNHLIDSLSSPEDLSFVDNEQNLDRYQKRDDMD